MPGKNNIGADKEEEEEKKPAPAAGGRKEKSVLQAKLTKLAIQIGYAGTVTCPSKVITQVCPNT